jgi:hypothetical protein
LKKTNKSTAEPNAKPDREQLIGFLESYWPGRLAYRSAVKQLIVANVNPYKGE